MTTRIEAGDKLIDILIHMQMAIELAKASEPEGEVQLAVISIKPDGTGHLSAAFESGELIHEMITHLGFKDINEAIRSRDGDSIKGAGRS